MRGVAGTTVVVDWVREHIRHGRLVPGQRLVEADIVAATGASRGKVREALRRLESEGLLTIEEFRGASVKRLGRDEVRQIYQARMALEGLAARECALRADAALRARLGADPAGTQRRGRLGQSRSLRAPQCNLAWTDHRRIGQ